MEIYSNSSKINLIPRIPVIVELNGKDFVRIFRNISKFPFDNQILNIILESTKEVLIPIREAQCFYLYGDRITVLLFDIQKDSKTIWCNYNIQKMVSYFSGKMTVILNEKIKEYGIENRKVIFESSIFNIPKDEVINYFIMKQVEAIRFLLLALARDVASTAEVYGKSNDEIRNIISQRGINLDDVPEYFKYGVFGSKNLENWKWEIMEKSPRFTNDLSRKEVSKHIYFEKKK